MHEAGKQGVLAQGHVNLAVTRPTETIASYAVRPAHPGSDAIGREIRASTAWGDVEVIESTIRVGAVCRKNPVDEGLV